MDLLKNFEYCNSPVNKNGEVSFNNHYLSLIILNVLLLSCSNNDICLKGIYLSASL